MVMCVFICEQILCMSQAIHTDGVQLYLFNMDGHSEILLEPRNGGGEGALFPSLDFGVGQVALECKSVGASFKVLPTVAWSKFTIPKYFIGFALGFVWERDVEGATIDEKGSSGRCCVFLRIRG